MRYSHPFEFLLLPVQAWLLRQPTNTSPGVSHTGWGFLSLSLMGAQNEVLGSALGAYGAALGQALTTAKAAGD